MASTSQSRGALFRLFPKWVAPYAPFSTPLVFSFFLFSTAFIGASVRGQSSSWPADFPLCLLFSFYDLHILFHIPFSELYAILIGPIPPFRPLLFSFKALMFFFQGRLPSLKISFLLQGPDWPFCKVACLAWPMCSVKGSFFFPPHIRGIHLR